MDYFCCFAPHTFILYKTGKRLQDYELDQDQCLHGLYRQNLILNFKLWFPYLIPFNIWASFLLLVLVFYRLLKSFKCTGKCLWVEHLTSWLAFIFAVNGSLWFWIIYTMFLYLGCGTPNLSNAYREVPWISFAYLFLIVIIILTLIIISIRDAIMMEEAKFLRKCLTAAEASEYMETLLVSAPIQRVQVEVFHEDVSRPRYGRTEGRIDRSRHFEGTIDLGEVVKNKIVTFTENRDFDYDTWEDPTNYPDLNDLLEENPFLEICLSQSVEAGDAITQQILETFKRNLMASCAYRDQMVNEQLDGSVPALKITKLGVARKENVSWWFSPCGLWTACLLSVSVFVRISLKMKLRKISLNIKKKYYANPTNVRRYDFEDSIPGGHSTISALDGAAGSSLLPRQKPSRNPSPTPTSDKMNSYEDTDRQPTFRGEKPPPSYEDAIL